MKKTKIKNKDAEKGPSFKNWFSSPTDVEEKSPKVQRESNPGLQIPSLRKRTLCPHTTTSSLTNMLVYPLVEYFLCAKAFYSICPKAQAGSRGSIKGGSVEKVQRHHLTFLRTFKPD